MRDKAEAGKGWAADRFPGHVSVRESYQRLRKKGMWSDLRYHKVAWAARGDCTKRGRRGRGTREAAAALAPGTAGSTGGDRELRHGPRGEPGSGGMKQRLGAVLQVRGGGTGRGVRSV